MGKQMKTPEDLIEHLKSKGVKFNIIDENSAKEHLKQHSNFFKLSAYRKNYPKYLSGPQAGKYEQLDFAYLVELARIDVEIRAMLLSMSLDIEHFMKVALIKAVESRKVSHNDEDGYKIIQGYLSADDVTGFVERIKTSKKRKDQYNNRIVQGVKNLYCSELVEKYENEMPIWAYVELCSFGDIKDLINYYQLKTGWSIGVDMITLDRVRQIRNACAHGNCIINDLGSKKNVRSRSTGFIGNYLSSANIRGDSRHRKMSNHRINQIVHLIYAFDKLVMTNYTRHKRIEELKELVNYRLIEHRDYFANNQILSSTYIFFKKICENLK